jgi:hypothetical protein
LVLECPVNPLQWTAALQWNNAINPCIIPLCFRICECQAEGIPLLLKKAHSPLHLFLCLLLSLLHIGLKVHTAHK